MKKVQKIIILQTSGNELANQLWNYISIYAYAQEKGYALENPAFFEYGNYFTMQNAGRIFSLVFFAPFTNYTKRKTAFRRRLWKKLYFAYAHAMFRFFPENTLIYSDAASDPYYLPPTKESSERLRELEDKQKNIYLSSWLFRNPIGIQKYRKEILHYFKPRQDIANNVAAHIKKIRGEFKHVVGVHIRQGDYKQWRGGAYFIPQTRVKEVCDEYLKTTSTENTDICFIITSDGPIDTSLFSGLNISVSKENAVYDLFLLSSTDIIIGSNSTFGAFASYYGNIPFIVMQKEQIDWSYYADKKTYFENKYSTMVRY
jgi:hypothetical protein